MFEVGIKETDEQLTKLEERLKNIVTNYGKLELKVQVDGLKAFTAALENIGQSKGLDALQKRIDVLQVTLANVGMSGAKSIQEFEAAVKTTSAVAEQYTQRINQMTAARDKFANGSTQWMSLNNKLTDFQNDKQVIAIYAQEQVAIKNLEDAKARLSNTNAQEVESYQKVISSIETLSTAANTLKTALGSWDAGKGNIAQLVEQFEKLHKEISGIATSLKGIDPSKLNFSGLNINVGNIAGLGDLNSAIRGLEVSINDIIRLFSNLANAVKLQPLDDQVKALLERCERAETKLRDVGEAARYLNERAGERTQQKSQNIAGIAGLNEENIERVSNLFERYRKLLADVQNQTANIGGIQNVAEKLGLNPTIVDQAAKRFEALWKTIENSMVGMEKYKGFPVLEKSSDQLAKIRADFNALRSEYKQVIQEANNFNRSTEKGSSQSEARIRKLGMAFNELKNYMKANGGSDEMKRLQTEIQGAIRKMRDLMNAGDFSGASQVFERISGAIRQATSATKEYEKSKQQAAAANNQLTSSEQQLANAIKGTSDQMRGQSQILSDLKSMAMQYLSVWGAQSFINNIIEIGGQLEMQRLSIGAILQDTEHANDLFEKIKTQALKSPFGVVELDAMTKQLSAYGFQYNELFDMTKRLADISAATGTGVDRLALALGHVRSEAALSGYTLRQFSMANIPLAKKLSEHLSEVEKRFVSVAEVRKRVRSKDIGYEDVVKVLKDLTDEGGMFYNAQEVMASSIKARFKNLRDAFAIMYGEIAESSVGDSLKELATSLTVLAKNWKSFIPLLEAGTVAFGAYKLSVLATNAALGANNASVVRNIMSYKQKQAVELQSVAIVRELTVSEKELIRTKDMLTAANIRVAMSTGSLTKADALRLVGLRKVSLEESKALVRMGLLSAAEVRAARSGSIMGIQMGKLGNQIKLLGASAATSVANLAKTIINPWTIAFAAMSAGMSMWQNYKQRQEDMANYVDSIRSRSVEGSKNLTGTVAKMNDVDVKKASADDLKMAISQIIDKLKDYDPSWQLSLKEAFTDEQTGKVRSQAEQFERLRNALNETADAYKHLKETKEAFMNADDSSGGKWYELQERFSTNVNDYNDAFGKYGKAATELAGHIDEVEEALRRAIAADNEFAQAAEGKSMREQIDILMRNWNDYGNGTNFGAAKTAFEKTLNENGIINGLNEAASRMDNLNRAWWALQASAERFKERLYKDLVTNGNYPKDPSQWSKAQNDAVLMEYNAFFDQFAANVPENMRSDIISMINDLRTDITGGAPWRIPVMFGVGEPKQELEGWRADMQKWLNDHGLTFTITEEMSLEDVKKGIHAKLKEAQEIVDNSGRVLIKVGLDTSNLPSELPKALQTPWNQYNLNRYTTEKKNVNGYNEFLDTYNIEHPKDKNKNKGEDVNAKAVRERVRVIKEAADAYQYWREKVGDKSAWKHVEDEFGSVLKKIGITAKDINDVRKHLNNIPNTKEYQAIKDQKVKTEVDKEIAKENDQYFRKGFEKQTEEYLSKTKIKLDQLTRSWKTFNAVREATGDINIAVKLSGADFQLGVAENIAEELKKRIEKSMKDVGINPIELNVEWSDKDIENAVHDAFAASKPVREKGESEDDYKKRLQEYEAHIKSIVEETKKWRDLETELRDNAVTTYVNLLKDADSLTQKVRTANTEYEKQIEHLRVLRDLQVGDKNKISNDEYERLSRKADVNRKLTIASDLTSTLDWSATSQFFGKVFTDAGETLRNYLSKFISSDEFKGMDVTQQKKYLDLQANIDKSSGKYAQPLSPATWSNLAKKTKNVQDAFVDLVAKTKELEEAKQDEKDAAQALEDARKNGTGESEASYRLLQAASNRVSAENAVNQANKEVIQAEQERRTAEEEAVRGLNGLNSALGNITSGSLVELTMGFGNLIEMFSGKKNLSGTLSELLGGTSGTGQIIAAVLQLLDMLKDKSAEKVEEMLRGMFDAVVGILKDFLTGKLTEAIIEASIEGVGKIVEAIVENIPNMAMGGIGGLLKGEGIVFKSVEGLVKGLGSGFGNAIEGLLGVDFNNSNEAEVRESIDRLNKENERLATVIEEATKELKESNGMRAINAAKEAKDAQTQYNANIMNKWREGMGYHSAHHSNSYSWDLEDSTQDEVNAALRAYAEKTGKELKQINVDNWEEFMTLTPEEMDYIRKHAQGAWEDITTEGKYEWVHEYLNEYADQAGKLEEMSEELREKLTLQSVSGLHDQFVNELMDMEKSAKDFSKDFSKMLMKAVLNAQIADLLDDQLKQWRDTMATYMEEDGDNLSPAHIAELQKMWDNIVAQGLKIRDNVASAVGYTGEGSSSGLSSNIKNISEQTADILASYLNAVRADVAVNRQMISQYFPMYYQAMTTGNQSLKNIENHTSAIMQSNETIANRISALDDKVNGLKNGTWRMPVA